MATALRHDAWQQATATTSTWASYSPVARHPESHYSGIMESIDAIAALAALAQATRLDTFRLLVRHEPDGLPAGELARLLKVPPNTMSAHLGTLARAGLVAGTRYSRSIVYRANLERLRELILFLLKDCCGGDAALCVPLIAELTSCCLPVEAIQ